MTYFWTNKISPGFYDMALDAGIKSGNSVQAMWHHTTFSFVSKYIKNNQLILDYACGPATLTGKYLSLDSNPVCTDISSSQLNYARKIYPNKAEYLNQEEFKFENYKNQFDVVTCLGLLEFLSFEEGKLLLKNFYSILKPDGRLLITTPNFKMSMKVIEALLNSIGDLNYSNEYKSRYKLSQLLKLVEKSNFKSVASKKYMTAGIFMGIFSNKLAINLNRLIESLSRNNWGYLIFLELKK